MKKKLDDVIKNADMTKKCKKNWWYGKKCWCGKKVEPTCSTYQAIFYQGIQFIANCIAENQMCTTESNETKCAK